MIRRLAFIIDPQNMFMTLPGMPLPVFGADQDMLRVAVRLLLYPFYYDEIVVTLDTHTEDHIGHPGRWLNDQGQQPLPFTVITSAEYEAGKWCAADPADQVWQGDYLRLLEATGRVHTVWPVHGRKGHFEHKVYKPLKAALDTWERITGKKVRYIEKGMHRDTEQFGVFGANVPITGASETEINMELLGEVNSFDATHYFGEASSHCAKDSVTQNLAHIPEVDFSKYTVFRDCMSPVAAVVDEKTGDVIVDFPAQAEAWFHELQAKGVNVVKAEDYF